jgi:hypothetical protein
LLTLVGDGREDGRRREFKGGRLSPSGDGAQVAFQRRGGAADARLDVAEMLVAAASYGQASHRQIDDGGGGAMQGGGGAQVRKGSARGSRRSPYIATRAQAFMARTPRPRTGGGAAISCP